MRPLFGKSEERLRAMIPAPPSAPSAIPTDLSMFYNVDIPDERAHETAQRFREQDFVAYAYVEPRVGLPVRDVAPAPAPAEPPSVSPDFVNRQDYLGVPPTGINASTFAWQMPGGRGAGVRIIDIEGAWRLTHEDLLGNQGGLVAGTQINDINWRNHGTAVVGVIGGDNNGFGVSGVAPDAMIQTISHNTLGIGSFPSGVAAGITTAAEMLSPGDIILIEAHAPGPRNNFVDIGGQLGFVAMQYWPEVYAAITFATVVKGVIVVEAAGNGAENLDDPIYSIAPPGFPPFWSPFNRSIGDNASIIIGAGAPPPNTHGHGTTDPDRSRLQFSNFGACVDAQGWGGEVTTCGYGDLQGGLDENLWYTDRFGGTSSASPIVVGALACIQGTLKAAGRPLLTPVSARNLLRSFGSPQEDAPGRPASQRIGNRPDLFFMISGLV
jgi:hypothetical protein